jgi:hypothetical protein
MAGAMGRFRLDRGHVVKGEAWVRRALDLPGDDAPTTNRLKSVSTLPLLATVSGDHVALDQSSSEELHVARLPGDQYLEAFGFLHVGQAAALGGDTDQARRHVQSGVAASASVGVLAGDETLNLMNLASIAFRQGSDDGARAQAAAARASAFDEGWTRGFAQAYPMGASRTTRTAASRPSRRP